MIEQNPFSSYSLEDQNSIADQLRTLKGSNQLNSDQLSSVDNALKYLPMSKAQADANLLNLATHGAGTWQRPKQPGFGDVLYVDPQAKEFGGAVTRPGIKDKGWKTLLAPMETENQPVGPSSELVPYQRVKEARQALAQPDADMARIGDTLNRALEGDSLAPWQYIKQAHDYTQATTAKLGADAGEAFLRGSGGLSNEKAAQQPSPTAIGIARGLGGTGLSMAADPLTYATLGLGGRTVSAGFGVMGAVGTYQGAKELHEIWDREDIPQDRKVELATNVTLNAMMAGLAGSHSVRGFLKTTALSTEQQAVIANKIESEWQQLPSGKMIRRQAEGATTQIQPDVKVAGGPISKQFPPGSFFNRQISPAAPPDTPGRYTTHLEDPNFPSGRVPARDVVRPSDAEAPTGSRNVQSQLGRYLIVPNKPPGQPGVQSAPIETAGRAQGGPDAPYIGRYNTRPPKTTPSGEPPAKGPDVTPASPFGLPPRLPGESMLDWTQRWENKPTESKSVDKPGSENTENRAQIEAAGKFSASDAIHAAGMGITLEDKPPVKPTPTFKDAQVAGEGFHVAYDTSAPTDLEHSMMMGEMTFGEPAKPSSPTAQNPASPKLPDYISEQRGRWFTPDQKLAGIYGKEQLAVDVPSEVARQTDATRVQGRPEHILPDVWKDKAKPVGQMGDVPEGMVRLYRGQEPLSPAEKAALIKPDRTGVYDLRTVDPETRHEWINKNANFAPSAKDAADMMREGRKIYGPDRKFGVVSYLDKDGNLHHAIKLFNDKSGQPALHPQPDTAPPGESSVSRLSPTAAKTFADIQASEAKFNERTGGKHSEVLTDLWKATEKALPPDTPHEGKLNLYKKGLDALHDALTSGKGLTDLYKAFDMVKKGSEAGFLGGKGRRRLSDEELDRLTRLHVDTQLSKWERGGVALPVLTKPAFRSAVYGAGDPTLELRYEELLKNGGEGTDPVGMLANVVSGVTNKWLAKDIKSEQLARAAMTHEQRKGQLEEYRHDWNSRGIEDTLLYFDATEHGAIDSLTDPKDRESAKMLRTMLDQKRDAIRALGIGKLDHFIENYMGRMWRFGTKDVISQVAAMKRPFAGNASFLKQRSHEYFSDGIAAGLEPVTYNPIDMQLMKLHEMDRYLAAHTMFRDLKSYGLLREFTDKDAPAHWGTIDDNMFRAGEGKHWYAPREVAVVFNNHLSPGLRTGTRGLLYNPVANFNNLMNQANLSMSVFHGFETGFYSFTSDLSDVLGKVSRMDIPGLLKTGERWMRVDKGGPVAPLRHYLLGMKFQQEVMHPGQFAELSDDVDNFQKAGARIRMPEEFRNAAREGLKNAVLELRHKGFKVLGDNFAEMALDNPGVRAAKVALRSVGAIMEGMSIPIMEKWVPRIKIGVQLERQRDYMARNPDASPEQLRRGLRKLWDAGDDRFGEFTYDNLNIDRTYKDALHLVLRSVGWNFGTARTFVGAALPDVFNLRDPESFAGQIANKKFTGLTERQSFTLGLLGMTYISARILCGFFGTEPDEYTKMGYARTGGVNPDGSPSRVYVKNYVTDAYAMYHSPGQTTLNKLAPGWHMLGELYQNSDYWGNRIHPINPTTADALTDPANYSSLAKYAARSMEPFSFTNFQQRRARGEGPLSSLTSAAAILPAPSYIGQTKASSLAFDLFRTTLPRGPNDPDVAAKLQRYHELASGFAAGTIKEKDIDKALDTHEITEKQYDGILAEDEVGKKDGDLSVLERHVKYLTPNDFLRVFDYADPRERAALEDRFYQKWDSAVKNGDEELSKQFEQREKLFHPKPGLIH